MRRTLAALVLLAAAPLARADVVIQGNFHVGDEDNRPEFLPADPVDCTKYRQYPTRFHLTQAATITGFTLNDSESLDDTDITIDLDGTQRSALACADCLIGGTITITLTTGVSLAAGDHTVAVVDPSGTSTNCTGGNDFDWTQLTLVSTTATDSIMLGQRRHIGDDEDDDDNYDFTSISSSNQFYPDDDEATALNLSFTLGTARRLNSVRFNRLRDVNSTDGSVQVNGTSIGSLTSTGDPFTLSPSLLLAAGTHTLRVAAGTISSQKDDISWDGIILRFADTFSAGTPGFFNAVDAGGNALTGSITTKTAGGGFTLDLYALNGLGSGQDTTYNGAATVEVLNASNNSGTTDVYGCNSNWTVAQTLSSVTFVAGKAQVSGTFLTAGLKEARIKVTDSTTGAAGCSIDNFAIRPASLSVVPSHATESTAGTTTNLTNTATSGLPRHKAGQPFTIIATGVTAGGAAVTNYDGSPTAATPAVIAPATVVGQFFLGSWGNASGGARRTDTAAYSEVGAVTINLEDTSWASVDADDPTSTAAQRTITGSVATGRFIPDHFNVTDGILTTTCAAGSFSYLGGTGTLVWNTPAMTLTAVNGSNGTTQNYRGALETLPGTLAAPSYAVYDNPALAGTPLLNTTGLSDATTIGDAAAGVATITRSALAFQRTLVAAFDAEIAITFPDIRDADDVVPTRLTVGSATAGGGLAFTSGKSQRFGRLYFEPRYGSENLPITVPLRAEYFDGVSFVLNAADSCTTLNDGQVALAPAAFGQTKSLSPLAGAGPWVVTLSAPQAKGQATLTTSAALYPLLMGDNDGDGYDDDPTGVATFGVYTSNDKRIYQREVVGN